MAGAVRTLASSLIATRSMWLSPGPGKVSSLLVSLHNALNDRLEDVQHNSHKCIHGKVVIVCQKTMKTFKPDISVFRDQ